MKHALVAAGMSDGAALAKEEMFARLLEQLGGEPATAWFVPGRIEFLGKHTDYAGGRSLLCAVERGFCIAARPSAAALVRMTDLLTGQQMQFPLSPTLAPAAEQWSNYPMTVARRLAANFPGNLCGADIVFANDLPQASGLSSSSAFIVACFAVLSDINRLPQRQDYQQSIRNIEDLAGYLGAVESGQSFASLKGTSGVGTKGGSQDHTAILCSVAGELVKYSFAPVRKEGAVPLPAGHTLIVACSGVIAEKTAGALEKYNAASRAVGAMIRQWRQQTGSNATTLAAVVRSAPDAASRLRTILAKPVTADFSPQQLCDRLDQFLAESERIIPQTAAALAAGRLAEVGQLVDESQQWAQRALGNQIPETVFLAASARKLGATAASAFGAGFGGSVWALVPNDAAETFQREWAAGYRANFPATAGKAQLFTTKAGPPAMRVMSQIAN